MVTKPSLRKEPDEDRDVIVQYVEALDDVDRKPVPSRKPWGVHVGATDHASFDTRAGALDYARRLAKKRRVRAWEWTDEAAYQPIELT
jgi:hypothetical protein